MAYCTTVDLLIGDIPTSASLDPAKYVSDAADEIDSKIGFIYDTPIPNTVPRPVVLLLKRLNAHLASGRMILAATILGEDKQLNAYGASLVSEVELTLEAIYNRTLVLGGADYIDGTEAQQNGSGNAVTAPLISNLDSESSVEAFYNRIAKPGYRIQPDPLSRSGGLVSTDGFHAFGPDGFSSE